MTIRQGKAGYVVDRIMLHTSATAANWWRGKTADQMRDEIRSWHKAGGWRDIGYHRVVAPDGHIALGRSLYDIGAGCAGQNNGVLHVCMVPVAWVDRIGRVADFYTEAQVRAVRSWIRDAEEIHGSRLRVVGHNEYANKLCPGFRVDDLYWH